MAERKEYECPYCGSEIEIDCDGGCGYEEGVLHKQNSQKRRILSDLIYGDSLTPITALKEYGSFRLGARIQNIRDEGIEVDTIRKKGENWATYKLRQTKRNKARAMAIWRKWGGAL